jgi:hypothetical protein
MKFTSLVFAASMVASTQAQARGLQGSAQKWNLTDPTFTYDGLRFDLDYQVNDLINDNMVAFGLFNVDCKEGGVTVADGILASSKEDLTGVAGTGIGDRMLAFDIDLNPATITTDPNIYSESTDGSVTARIDFCVRMSLQTDSPPADVIEVNFLETLVTLFVDLSDGFTIGEVAVEPKIRLITTANQVYLIDGFQCDAEGVILDAAALAATRNQGSVIKVCVQPDEEALGDGIFMRSVDSFNFIRSDVAPVVSQPAITDGAESNNGLTSLTCTRGDTQCSFETILFAAFYTAVGTVGGEGVASMQFGNSPDGRRGLRALQAEPDAAAASEFVLDFGINPTADTNIPSGAASSSRVLAATALVVAGAFAML